MKAYKRRFDDNIYLVDESRKIEKPAVGYDVDYGWPVVVFSMAGTRQGIIPADSNLWADLDECKNNFEISIAVEEFGGKEALDELFQGIAGDSFNSCAKYPYTHEGDRYIIAGEKRKYALYEDSGKWHLDGLMNHGEDLDFETEGNGYFYIGEIGEFPEAPLLQAFERVKKKEGEEKK